MKFSVKDVINIVGGQPTPGDYTRAVSSVVIDSRQAAPGSLFVAFAGEKADGHDFLSQCARQGAVAALIERDTPYRGEMVTIKSENTLAALQRLAAWQRQRLRDLRVLAVTGSSGKTTTKELTAAVLAQKYETFKSRGNHNNAIGLPLMIFEIEARQRLAVLEMGMSAPGEIRELCQISRPSLGIITNIGEAHLEYLGSQEAIAAAKFELAEGLAPGSTLILNGDDPWQRRRAQAGLEGIKVLFYGLGPENSVQGTDIRASQEGTSFTAVWPGGSIPIKLNLLGAHNVYNALAAFSAGLALAVEPEGIARGLAGAKGEGRRLQAFAVADLTLIDDSYNANPDSVGKALAVLGTFSGARRRVAFLGDMLELGPESAEKHRQVGKEAARQGVDYLVAVGQYAGDLEYGAVLAGMKGKAVRTWADSEEALASVDGLAPGDVVLVKGSLGVKMDKIVEAIKARGTKKC